jgi:hypothetical protein
MKNKKTTNIPLIGLASLTALFVLANLWQRPVLSLAGPKQGFPLIFRDSALSIDGDGVVWHWYWYGIAADLVVLAGLGRLWQLWWRRFRSLRPSN